MTSQFRTEYFALGALLAVTAIGFVAFPAHAQNAVQTPTGLSPQVSKGNPALRTAQPSPEHSPAAPSSIDRILVEHLTNSAANVVDKIQEAETDFHTKLAYFEKPDRLDPSAYASTGEVEQWMENLRKLKDQHDKVEELYSDLGKNLDTALRGTGANAADIAAFKKYVMEGFPWSTIEKKKGLITEYIDEHQKLLTFYQKNWGSWAPQTANDSPKFTSASASANYKKLRDQITATENELEKTYQEMSQ